MTRSPSRPAALLLALLCTLVPALTVLAAPAEAAAPRTPVTRTAGLAVSTTEVDVGGVVRFSGRVTRTPRGGLVRLQRLVGHRWRTVATTRTVGARGVFSRRLTLRGDGFVSFRAVAPRAGRLRAAVSPVRRVDVVDPVEPGQVGRVARLGHESDLSGDGRWLAFSTSQALVEGDDNGTFDVYLRDLATGDVRLVSHEADGGTPAVASLAPSISADGRHVAFSTLAALVPGDDNGKSDVLRWDRDDDSFRLVTVAGGTAADGHSAGPSISADGRWVAFVSAATTLVDAAGGPAGNQVYLRDLNRADAGSVQLISRRPGPGPLTYAVKGATEPAVASAGSAVSVAFLSASSMLANVDDPLQAQAWVWRRDGVTSYTLVSATTSGVPAASAVSQPALSDDATTVAFTSSATDLVADQVDTNAGADVFVKGLTGSAADRRTRLVSGRGASDRITAAGGSDTPVLSGDGSIVAFTSSAPDLFAGRRLGGGRQHVVQRELDGRPYLVSHSRVKGAANGPSGQPRISADGWIVVFHSLARDLVSSPASPEALDHDVYRWDGPVLL